MKLKALKYVRYAGKPVHAGDVFEANEADVRVLLAIRTAEKYVEPPPKKVAAILRPTPVIDDVRGAEQYMAETSAAAINAQFDGSPVEGEKPKRAYKRRDLTAE